MTDMKQTQKGKQVSKKERAYHVVLIIDLLQPTEAVRKKAILALWESRFQTGN
jgi:hypothetical protein